MQFVTNGSDVPERLLQEHEDGRGYCQVKQFGGIRAARPRPLSH